MSDTSFYEQCGKRRKVNAALADMTAGGKTPRFGWWVTGGIAATAAVLISTAALMSTRNHVTPSVARVKTQAGDSIDRHAASDQAPLQNPALLTGPKDSDSAKALESGTTPAKTDRPLQQEDKLPDKKDDTLPTKLLPGPDGADKPDKIDDELQQVLVKPPAAFEKIFTLKGPSKPVVAVSITPDASRAVTCSDDGDCRCWDLKTGRELARYENKLIGKRFCVAITPDGKHALVGGEFNAVHAWDAQTGKHVFTHTAPKSRVTHVDVSADGRWMGAVDEKGSVFRYPTLGGMGGTIRLKRGEFTHFAFHPKGKYAILWAFTKDPIAAVFPTNDLTSRVVTIKTVNMARRTVHGIDVSDRYFVFHTGRDGIVTVSAPKGGAEKTKFHKSKTRLDSASLLRIVANDEFFVSMDSIGHVEIRPLKYSRDAITYQTQAKNISAVSAADDGLTVAFGHDNGDTSVWRLRAAAWPCSVRFSMLLNRYLLKEDYDALELIATRLRGTAEVVQRFSWDSRRTKYQTMIEHFAENRPFTMNDSKGTDQRLKEWLAAHPNSLTVRLAQAKRLIRAAWKARGLGFANTVTREGFQVFRDKIEEARTILVPIADSKDPPGEVFPLLFDVAKTQSWNRQKVQNYMKKLMETAPTLSAAHVTVAEMLLPRWGGFPGEMQSYATDIADTIGGAKGNAEYAKILLRIQRYLPSRSFYRTSRFDRDRFHNGLVYITKNSPDDIEILNEILKFASTQTQNDFSLAGWCVDKLKGRDQQWSLRVWRNYSSYERAKKWTTDFGTNDGEFGPDIAPEPEVAPKSNPQPKAESKPELKPKLNPKSKPEPKPRADMRLVARKRLVLQIRLSLEDVRRATAGAKDPFDKINRFKVARLIRAQAKSKAIELGGNPNNIGLPNLSEVARFKRDAFGYSGKMTIDFYPFPNRR